MVEMAPFELQLGAKVEMLDEVVIERNISAQLLPDIEGKTVVDEEAI